jgi:hypothetical protein
MKKFESLSDFVHNATTAEKKKLIKKVLKSANKMQKNNERV